MTFNFCNWLCGCKENEVTKPLVLGKITNAKVTELLQKHAKQIYLSDDMYDMTSVAEAKRYSKESQVWAKNYVAGDHDCDNFSFALNGYWSESLKSFCFGIAWTNEHAFNIMIDDLENILICEPQTNNWYTIEQKKGDKKFYPFKVVMI